MEILDSSFKSLKGKLIKNYTSTSEYNPLFLCPPGEYCHHPELNPDRMAEFENLLNFESPVKRTSFHLPTQGKFLIDNLISRPIITPKN